MPNHTTARVGRALPALLAIALILGGCSSSDPTEQATPSTVAAGAGNLTQVVLGAPDSNGEYLWWHTSGIEPSPRISTNVARFGKDAIDQALDRSQR